MLWSTIILKRFYEVDISGGDERIIIIERVQIYTCKMHSFIEIMIECIFL